MRIGVDTGGTFTDCVVFKDSRIEILKVFSTPEEIASNTLEAVRRLAGGHPGEEAAELPTILHGTTVGTNALLERRGARVALITTAGFEDLIEIGRQNRPRLYDLNVQRDPPLVPRALRWGAPERTLSDGSILLRPSAAALARLRTTLRRSGADSVAICFLFSYANPANEQAVARSLRSLGLPLSVSHEILPEFREYERLSTTVINAYLAPRLGRYLAGLEREARRQFRVSRPKSKRGGKIRAGRLFVMQSSGGITTAARAAREPVRTILSGPAGGVVATSWLADLLGLRRVISFDMGGTSTDVCLLDGRAAATRETTFAGLPVAVPVLDVHSVGAGGGSLARLDAGGALRVGPESASARPGPICYGAGGTQPTITDAHLILGRLDADFFLGGEFRLDLQAAEVGFQNFLRQGRFRASSSRSAFRTSRDLATGMIAVANATMEKALRVISVERGHDPRDFSLVCFGGAGGLHAVELARSLGLARVIVPSNPGAFSALGVLLSDVVTNVSQSVLLPVPIRAATVRERATSTSISSTPLSVLQSLDTRFLRLEREAREKLRKDGFAAGFSAAAAQVERRLDLRYRGQSYELSVPFTPRFAAAFHRAHERAYGYADPTRPLEVVNLRVRLILATPKPRLQRHRPVAGASREKALGNALVKRKAVWFGRRVLPTPFYDRERLLAGTRVTGPAVIVEYSSTTVIPPGFTCRVDEYLNLVLQISSPTLSS